MMGCWGWCLLERRGKRRRRRCGGVHRQSGVGVDRGPERHQRAKIDLEWFSLLHFLSVTTFRLLSIECGVFRCALLELWGVESEMRGDGGGCTIFAPSVLWQCISKKKKEKKEFL